jgi:hexosaminidase
MKTLLKNLILILIWICLPAISFAQVLYSPSAAEKSFPALVPYPQRISIDSFGKYVIKERSIFMNYLETHSLSPNQPSYQVPFPASDLKTELLSRYDTLIGKEGYHLRINESGVSLKANTHTGLLRGFQTLRQIVQQSENATLSLQFVSITDYPAFQWRGMLLDCCRHFMEKDFVLRYIDLLAFYKMNVFHWHLTEDQGWRIQIDQYPLLTEVGAWRREADGTLYGGFYNKEEIREVVAYAAARGITVVPEIEMPGHALAALAAYPSMSCTGGPFEVPTTWGVFKDIYCAGNDSVFIFLKNILDEVLELFPSEYIHIGGDEAPKYRWENCPKCQKRMADNHLKDGHELQSWFIKQIAVYLESKGRKLIGWDEIIEGGLVEGVTIQSWQGFEGAKHAAETGNNAVVSPTSHAYFDYPIHKITLSKVYEFDPVPPGLHPDLHHHILGGECNIWTERAPQHLVDQKVFPRLLAMSEVLWTYPEKSTERVYRADTSEGARDYHAFRERVRKHYPILAALGVDYGLEEGGLKIVAVASESSITVSMIPEQDNITIRYGLWNDSTELKYHYKDPIVISDSLTLHTAAYIGDKRVSQVYTRRFNLHPGLGAHYTLSMKPGSTYNKNPKTTLTDGIRGTTDFHDGLWLGFWEKDLSVHFRFSEPRNISEVRVGFMQSNPSWIFLPTKMHVTIKPQGLFRKKLRYTATTSTPKDAVMVLEDFVVRTGKPITAKSIHISIENPGKCPDWHPGAGSPTWIFIDEIELRIND